MRQIKFRGKRLSDGETIYGYYHVQKGTAFIDEWSVDPETVARFVGTDRNGDEVYEGDVVESWISGETVKALIGFRYENSHGLTSVPVGGKLGFYTLKK